MSKKGILCYHDGYANLAAAILDSGIKCNDTAFLESDWADTLRDICVLDDEMYGNRNINACSRSVVSIDRGGRKIGFN